jgi:hypothetical protein
VTPGKLPEDALANASREEIMAALFANMVVQQTNMALMLLGKVPHPETGEIMQDLETAKMFVDQLEMLDFKTKGNLSPEEASLLMQGLDAVHGAIIEVLENQAGESSAPAETAPPVTEDEARKKFSKKY